MHSGRVEPSFLFFMSIWDVEENNGNSRLLHLDQLLLLTPLQALTIFTAGAIVNLETILIDVFSLVPGQKITSLAVGFIYSTCRFIFE